MIIFEMSQSSSSACASVSDSEIFRTVRKDSDDRLRNELKRAQDYYSLELIDSMTRDELVLAVAKLRKFSNQLVAVKNLTSGFDPKFDQHDSFVGCRHYSGI